MIVLKHLNEIPATLSLHHRMAVGLTIGNFDGVHYGHKELLRKIAQDCKDKNLRLVVLTFIPHPQNILNPERKGQLLNTFAERRELLEQLGTIDYLVELDFSRDFSTLAPEDFLKKFLFKSAVNIKKIYLGHDFSFGSHKSGGIQVVKDFCEPRHVEVEKFPEFHLDENVVSSSLIRECLQEGKVDEARKYLGRPFFLSGMVVRSAGRGKAIGLPTANIAFDNYLIVPQKGVYISETEHNGILYQSVTNIGNNPTFVDSQQLHVETHILDFSLDIYGEQIKVSFAKKIRDEKKFSSVHDLVAQIRHDIQVAQDYFAHR